MNILNIAAWLLIFSLSTVQAQAAKNTCLSRTMPDGSVENFSVQDADAAVNESLALLPNVDEIEITTVANHICMPLQLCYVNKGDRIKLFKWHDDIILGWHSPGGGAKQIVLMKWTRSSTRPNFLAGKDAQGNAYFLLFTVKDSCSYDTNKKCRKYTFEVYPKDQTDILTPEVNEAWLPSHQCPARPSQPGGGSGEDPPKGPG
jgi:hypothetical protein